MNDSIDFACRRAQGQSSLGEELRRNFGCGDLRDMPLVLCRRHADLIPEDKSVEDNYFLPRRTMVVS